VAALDLRHVSTSVQSTAENSDVTRVIRRPGELGKSRSFASLPGERLAFSIALPTLTGRRKSKPVEHRFSRQPTRNRYATALVGQRRHSTKLQPWRNQTCLPKTEPENIVV
jgi:hypothetical protein